MSRDYPDENDDTLAGVIRSVRDSLIQQPRAVPAETLSAYALLLIAEALRNRNP